MGGTILVSKGRGFATSTVDFDYLVERIRVELTSLYPTIAVAAYEPIDKGGMTFIALDELNSDSYRCFVEATKKAKSKASADALFPQRYILWHQLSDMLHSDVRLLEFR